VSIKAAQQAVVDHLMSVGHFDNVAQHEPAQPPGKGLYASMWFEAIRPVADLSSLAAAGMLYVYVVRMYKNTESTPKDSIDIGLVEALDAVCGALIEDTTLGDSAFTVDVLGAYSDGIQATTDYVDFGRNQWYRVIDLSLPVVLDGRHRYAG
jgi:hypothetical protein